MFPKTFLGTTAGNFEAHFGVKQLVPTTKSVSIDKTVTSTGKTIPVQPSAFQNKSVISLTFWLTRTIDIKMKQYKSDFYHDFHCDGHWFLLRDPLAIKQSVMWCLFLPQAFTEVFKLSFGFVCSHITAWLWGYTLNVHVHVASSLSSPWRVLRIMVCGIDAVIKLWCTSFCWTVSVCVICTSSLSLHLGKWSKYPA